MDGGVSFEVGGNFVKRFVLDFGVTMLSWIARATLPLDRALGTKRVSIFVDSRQDAKISDRVRNN